MLGDYNGKNLMTIVLVALFLGFVSCAMTAFAAPSVHDPIEQVASKPDVKVSANRRDIDRIKKEVRASHFLDGHFDFDFDTDWFRKTPRVEWKIDGKKWWYDEWTGQDKFIAQYVQTGGTYY